jgi:hypothetical protein
MVTRTHLNITFKCTLPALFLLDLYVPGFKAKQGSCCAIRIYRGLLQSVQSNAGTLPSRPLVVPLTWYPTYLPFIVSFPIIQYSTTHALKKSAFERCKYQFLYSVVQTRTRTYAVAVLFV